MIIIFLLSTFKHFLRPILLRKVLLRILLLLLWYQVGRVSTHCTYWWFWVRVTTHQGLEANRNLVLRLEFVYFVLYNSVVAEFVVDGKLVLSVLLLLYRTCLHKLGWHMLLQMEGTSRLLQLKWLYLRRLLLREWLIILSLIYILALTCPIALLLVVMMILVIHHDIVVGQVNLSIWRLDHLLHVILVVLPTLALGAKHVELIYVNKLLNTWSIVALVVLDLQLYLLLIIEFHRAKKDLLHEISHWLKIGNLLLLWISWGFALVAELGWNGMLRLPRNEQTIETLFVIGYQSTSHHKWPRIDLRRMLILLWLLYRISLWMIVATLRALRVVMDNVFVLVLRHLELSLPVLLAVILWRHLLVRCLHHLVFLEHTDRVDTPQIVVWLVNRLRIYLEVVFESWVHIAHR